MECFCSSGVEAPTGFGGFPCGFPLNPQDGHRASRQRSPSHRPRPPGSREDRGVPLSGRAHAAAAQIRAALAATAGERRDWQDWGGRAGGRGGHLGLWVKTNGITFEGFRCTTHFRTYFGGDWDVHWGYGSFNPWPFGFGCGSVGVKGINKGCNKLPSSSLSIVWVCGCGSVFFLGRAWPLVLMAKYGVCVCVSVFFQGNVDNP